jgi:thiamine pyrophosphokinase
MKLPSHLKNNYEWVFLGPMGPFLLERFQHYPLICVDGGAHFTHRMDLWVGDGDSYKGEVKTEYKYEHTPHKDLSDLALALSLFREQTPYTFFFWGFLGGRRDHEMFNLGEGLSFLEAHSHSTIFFFGEDTKIYYELKGPGEWRFHHQGLFSLGTLKKGQVTLSGEVRYPISQGQVLGPLSSQGLSNLGFGEILLKNAEPLFIYYPEGK